MKASYMIKSERLIPCEKAKEIAELYEKATDENIILSMPSDVELYKLVDGKYIRVI